MWRRSEKTKISNDNMDKLAYNINRKNIEDSGEHLERINDVHISSVHSMRVSLNEIRLKKAGLNEHRSSMLKRVPNIGDWGNFPPDSLTTKDLAYLSAFTGHEFAILRGKRSDVLFHGNERHCNFSDELVELLKNGRYRLYAHSHPDHENIVPSEDDRQFLKTIHQESSIIVSWITGVEQTFGCSLFDI